MKSIRLLPIVIFATIALLIFKGAGLLTGGGYVLGGATIAMAQEAEGLPGADNGAPTLTLPSAPTMVDTSPTMDDGTPTLPSTAEPTPTLDAEVPAVPDLSAAPAQNAVVDCAPMDPASPTGAEASPTAATSAAADCAVATADAVPMVEDAAGNKVPLVSENGRPLTEKALLERLAERRDTLDARADELDMREVLIEAADRRIEERMVALKALEAQISALVDEKKVAEDAQFKVLVGMYEGMKAADAAKIFNDLDLNVLVRLTQSMNPRKLAPIMAKMIPTRAQEVTVRMAADQGEPTIEVAGSDLSALPQIVGQ